MDIRVDLELFLRLAFVFLEHFALKMLRCSYAFPEIIENYFRSERCHNAKKRLNSMRNRTFSTDPYARAATLYEPLIEPVAGRVRKRLAAMRGWSTALDVCCGTGAQARDFTAAGVFAVGADLSPAMLAEARRRAPDLSFVRCDAARLPFEDACFDGAVACLGLHEMDEETRLDACREMARVAQECILVDYALPQSWSGRLLRLLAHVPERLAGKDHYRGYKDFMRRGGVEGLAGRAGLRVLERLDIFYGAAAVLVCVKP